MEWSQHKLWYYSGHPYLENGKLKYRYQGATEVIHRADRMEDEIVYEGELSRLEK